MIFAARRIGASPAVLHLGVGAQRWWVGGRDVVYDGSRLWWVRGPRVLAVALAGVQQVVGTAGALGVATADGHQTRIDPRGAARMHRPRTWRADGFIYQRRAGRVRAMARCGTDRRWTVGPRGALVGGCADRVDLGGAPGRTPQPLPLAVWRATLRFRPDGTAVAAVADDGDLVQIDLVRRILLARSEGTPIAYRRRRTVDGRLLCGERLVRTGLAEYSCAISGTRLAGPGGVIWDLTTGRRRFTEARLALGVTVPHPGGGFVTVDWATDRGWRVTDDGEIRDRFALDLADGDTLVAGCPDQDGVRLQSALGHQWGVVAGQVRPRTGPPIPTPAPTQVDSPWGPQWAAGSTVVAGQRYAWAEDGWLWAWPEAGCRLRPPGPDHSSASTNEVS